MVEALAEYWTIESTNPFNIAILKRFLEIHSSERGC